MKSWPDRFDLGANYWASHAGLFMWRDWRPDQVERDFKALARERVRVLRVFPLWPDFQPIHLLRGGGGAPVEIRHGETPLQGEGFRHGLDETMLDRFAELADLAQQEGLRLIVGLVTGWMSGRRFVPPALEGLNPITDPGSILWQIRFVKEFADRFRDHSAVVAWDLGNECNCMGTATREQAWLWTSSLADAIRVVDPSRLVISGMHSLAVDPSGPWSIRDQGELTDLLTTHPYPIWTPHCNREPLNSFRPILHAAAETCLYSDLSGKPAIAEEIGTMGPMICSDEASGGFARASLFSLWTHGAASALWWCAHDQTELTPPPYDWNACERELGLLRIDGTPKPALREMRKMSELIDRIPALPARRIEAVCLLTPGQDSWGVAFSSFLLAKQAGFDMRFASADRPLPESDLYLVPSLGGLTALSRRRQNELFARVSEGATVYLSLGDAFISEFKNLIGLEVESRSERATPCRFSLGEEPFAIETALHYRLLANGATVLARESDGNPVFSLFPYGKGKVYFLAFPLEAALASQAGAFLPGAQPFWHLYRLLAEEFLRQRLVSKSSPWIGLTEHAHADGSVTVGVVNYIPQAVEARIGVHDDLEFHEALFGLPLAEKAIRLEANGVALWHFRRKQPAHR